MFGPSLFFNLKGAYYNQGFGLVPQGGLDGQFIVDNIRSESRGTANERLFLRPQYSVSGETSYFANGMEAIPHWRAALERDPGHVDALLRMGSALARRGRAEEARPYLEEFVARAPRPPYDREAVNAAAWLRTHPAPKG